MELDFEYLTSELNRILPQLCEIEKEICQLRFGLISGTPSTLNDISSELDISIYQIREVENNLLSLVRHPSRSNVLRDYLEEDTFEKYKYEEISYITSRTPIREPFTTKFELFFQDILTIDRDENFIKSVMLNELYIEQYFEKDYGREFNPDALHGEAIYENICQGYFSWSSEFDFLVDLTLGKWLNEEPNALEIYLPDQLTWMDKVGFAISLVAKILNAEPLELALNYVVSAPRENYLSALLSFETRSKLNLEMLTEGLVSEKVHFKKELIGNITSASDKYAIAYGKINRDTESRILFYCADLVSKIYWYARWGCAFQDQTFK